MTPFTPQQQQIIVQALKQRLGNRFSVFTPLYIRQIHLGFVNTFFAHLIYRDLSPYAQEYQGGINILADSWIQAGKLLESTAKNWHTAGLYDGWRDEQFDVTDKQGNVLFALERSAFRPLGLLSHAIHINGYIEKNGEHYFWIGKRSPHKPVDPNRLDNLTGGGVASGETIHSAMIREGFEEAGLPENLLKPLNESACCLSVRPVHRGLHREYLHIYNVRLPENFIPENQDGEVSALNLMPIPEILSHIENNQFMNDAVLAMVYAFVELGYLSEAPLFIHGQPEKN
ncbi:MAG: NUDIX domain-containing protein [Neisseriaceae bacterium]|nr:NUDIX domain-containing protein [Neisseriaceae bacterium]